MALPIIIEASLEEDELLLDTNMSVTGFSMESDLDLSQQINDHRQLFHRDAPDQHPINAITGLNSQLTERPHEAISDAEIWVL